MTAVVLGAGGAAGWAFHAGAVAGLAEAGLDLGSASTVVATSAGAPVAASVLAGASTDAVVAALLRAPTPDEIDAYRATLAAARSRWWRRLRPAAPGLARAVLPGGPGVGVALAGVLPAGLFPTTPLRRAPGIEELGEDWPDRLWIPAVGLADGRRVVFGRDRLDLAVADAVEATQAVPVMFTPRSIDGQRFVDGATHSPTNADLLLGQGDPGDGIRAGRSGDREVVVVAPMARHPTTAMRRFARTRLRDEVTALRAAGHVVTVIEPDDEVAERLDGFPRRDPGAVPAVVAGGRTAVLSALG